MAPLAVAMIAVLVWAFGVDRVLVSAIPFAALLAAITVIDLRELRVPNVLVGPGVVLAVPLLLLASTSAWPELSFWRALAAGGAMFAGYLALAIVYPAGMGLGDVKLAPIIGAQLGLFGWTVVMRGLLAAFVLVGPVALILLLLRKAGAKTALPFAPFMAGGAVLALVLEGLSRT